MWKTGLCLCQNNVLSGRNSQIAHLFSAGDKIIVRQDTSIIFSTRCSSLLPVYAAIHETHNLPLNNKKTQLKLQANIKKSVTRHVLQQLFHVKFISQVQMTPIKQINFHLIRIDGMVRKERFRLSPFTYS